MYCVLIKDATKEDLGIAIFFFCAWQLIYCLYTIWFLRKGNYYNHEELNGWKRYCVVMFVWLGGSITSAIETLAIVYSQGKYFFLTFPDGKWITQQGIILGVSTIFWITDIIFGLPSILKLIWSICCSSPPSTIMINLQEAAPSYGVEPSAPNQEDDDDDDQSIILPENASTCVICLVRPANVYLKPCHHLCLCTKDARQLMQQVIRKCPLDNQTIQSTVQVFPS